MEKDRPMFTCPRCLVTGVLHRDDQHCPVCKTPLNREAAQALYEEMKALWLISARGNK